MVRGYLSLTVGACVGIYGVLTEQWQLAIFGFVMAGLSGEPRLEAIKAMWRAFNERRNRGKG